MGIPSYFSQIIRKYAKILKNINQVNDNKEDRLTHLYMDCNSIIYDSYHDISDEYDICKKYVTWYSVNSINIVNILRGKMYIWKSLPKIDILDILSSPLQSIYNFHNYEIDTLEKRIIELREWKKDTKYKELNDDDSYIDTSF